jgi:hypothetical protein
MSLKSAGDNQDSLNTFWYRLFQKNRPWRQANNDGHPEKFSIFANKFPTPLLTVNSSHVAIRPTAATSAHHLWA